jgi:hypothetical protein
VCSQEVCCLLGALTWVGELNAGLDEDGRLGQAAVVGEAVLAASVQPCRLELGVGRRPRLQHGGRRSQAASMQVASSAVCDFVTHCRRVQQLPPVIPKTHAPTAAQRRSRAGACARAGEHTSARCASAGVKGADLAVGAGHGLVLVQGADREDAVARIVGVPHHLQHRLGVKVALLLVVAPHCTVDTEAQREEGERLHQGRKDTWWEGVHPPNPMSNPSSLPSPSAIDHESMRTPPFWQFLLVHFLNSSLNRVIFSKSPARRLQRV